jgi:Domain of unknown function (DUF4184)
MPFTFSHPAIVLPLISKKLRLSATGLIIGSIIPDFEYFIRMKDSSRYSHTWPGLFWFDLPLALLVCFIYHLIVRNPLFDNLPMFLKERFIIYKKFNWIKYFLKSWIIVFISVLIGAASHILWDAFTHESLFFVERDPELSTLMKIGTINLAGYRFLQLSNSIIGLAVVILVIILLKKNPCGNKRIDYKYWALAALITFSVMFMRFIARLNIHDHRKVLVSFISSIMIALILTPMILAQQAQIREEFSEKKSDQ